MLYVCVCTIPCLAGCLGLACSVFSPDCSYLLNYSGPSQITDMEKALRPINIVMASTFLKQTPEVLGNLGSQGKESPGPFVVSQGR